MQFGSLLDIFGQMVDKMAFDHVYDLWVFMGIRGCDDHMQMVRQYHDRFDGVTVPFFTFHESFS